MDNAGGHIMQQGEVDLMITGTDRTTANGDVANKIGTYLKALAAHDNDVPFYVAAPSTSVDLSTASGAEIPIEERDASEVIQISGTMCAPPGVAVWNPAFDITPAKYVTAIVTEAGVLCPPYRTSLKINCSRTAEGVT